MSISVQNSSKVIDNVNKNGGICGCKLRQPSEINDGVRRLLKWVREVKKC